MTEREFIVHVKTLTKRCHGPLQVIRVLELAGFEVIGGGAFKKVFHKPGTEFVVKVFRRRTYWYYDHSTCGIIPADLKPYWLRNVFVSRRFVIQPLANGIGGDENDAIAFFKRRFGKHRAYKRFDLWHENTRYHNSRPVVVDFSDWEKKKQHPKYRWPTL